MWENIPLELIGGVIGTFSGGIMQLIGNQTSLMFKLIEQQQIENQRAEDSHDRASGRGKNTSWLQYGVAAIIMIVAFLGLMWAANSGHTLAIEIEKPARSFLGLFNWGGTTKFISAPEGSFALPKYVSVAVTSLIGFTFGRSAMKIRRL
jgi:hypothetical protein